MTDWYMEPITFSGTLGIVGHRLDVKFTAGIGLSGEVVIKLERFPRSSQSRFIDENWDPPGSKFGHFTLEGVAGDGTTFRSEDVIFTTLGRQFSEREAILCPVASYSKADFVIKRDTVVVPHLKVLVKGFENLGTLNAETSLGPVLMVGATTLEETDHMSGHIAIAGRVPIEDLATWRDHAGRLADRIRYVMSFAAATMLGAPIVEFAHDGLIELQAYSQCEQASHGMRPFHARDQAPIFQCAIKSHFEPAFRVENLHFAIEWFAMRSSYYEASLISAMTVLENLIDCNLSEEEARFLPEKAFDKLRKKLRKTVKEEAAVWTEKEAEQAQYVSDFNERFGDLNRRSLMDKIDLLVERWGVNLDSISQDSIQAAKKARDLVVHKGFYQLKDSEKSDLFEHMLTTRELVVRFILTALQYEGKYYSYVGGYHERQFVKSSPSFTRPV